MWKGCALPVSVSRGVKLKKEFGKNENYLLNGLQAPRHANREGCDVGDRARGNVESVGEPSWSKDDEGLTISFDDENTGYDGVSLARGGEEAWLNCDVWRIRARKNWEAHEIYEEGN